MKALALVALLVLGACSSTIAAPESQMPIQTSAGLRSPDEGVISRGGAGPGNSDTFELQGGDYMATWQVTDHSGSACLAILTLLGDAGSTILDKVIARGSDYGTRMHETVLTDVSPGPFHIRSESECPWQVVLKHAVITY